MLAFITNISEDMVCAGLKRIRHRVLLLQLRQRLCKWLVLDVERLERKKPQGAKRNSLV